MAQAVGTPQRAPCWAAELTKAELQVVNRESGTALWAAMMDALVPLIKSSTGCLTSRCVWRESETRDCGRELRHQATIPVDQDMTNADAGPGRELRQHLVVRPASVPQTPPHAEDRRMPGRERAWIFCRVMTL